MQHRAQVFGAITICDLIQMVPILIIRFNEIPTRVWFENVLQLSALLTCIVSRNKRANIAALAARDDAGRERRQLQRVLDPHPRGDLVEADDQDRHH